MGRFVQEERTSESRVNTGQKAKVGKAAGLGLNYKDFRLPCVYIQDCIIYSKRKENLHARSVCCVLCRSGTRDHQTPLSMEFSRQEY